VDFRFWRLLISSCNLLIPSPCRFISSIYFSNFSDASIVVTGMATGISVVVVDVIVVVDVLIPMRGISFSGMTYIGTLCSCSLTKFSILASISLIYAFFSMISFIISSLWPSVSTISFSSRSSVVGIFNCFLKDVISTFFFLMSYSTSLTLNRSYPIFNTNSYRDLILLSLAMEDIFSSLS
jgi:hypothetical protein